MPIESNLNRIPYFDDFDPTDNYYRILFRPSTAVQARELTQIQSIQQDQIEKFGKHFFVDGSVVEGCALTFDSRVPYLKISDNYTNGTAISTLDLENKFIIASSNLQAFVVSSTEGSEGNPPDFKTLYVKYINTGTFANGSPHRVFRPSEQLTAITSANVAVGTLLAANVSASPTGFSYLATITEGVIFQKGTFIRAPGQTVVVSKYNNQPNNVSIGFRTTEAFITSDVDTTLLDNATGSPNSNAPGAHRLRLIPSLVVRDIDFNNAISSNAIGFFSLADFENGKPVRIRTDPEYAKLGVEMARRTYEESGNYVVDPFELATLTRFEDNSTANTTFFSVEIDKGIGYIQGYRVQFRDKRYVPNLKGIDTQTVNTQVITGNFGNYVLVNEVAGAFDINGLDAIDLLNTPARAVTSGTLTNNAAPIGTVIGTANIRTVKYDSGNIGTPQARYKAYIFNVKMAANAPFSNIRSIYGESSGVKAFGDVVLESNNAILKETNLSSLIVPLGQKAVKNLRDASNNYNAEFVFRTSNNVTFSAAQGSVATLNVPIGGAGTSGQELPYGGGTLSSTSELDFVVVSLNSANTPQLTGTVQTSDNTVIGTGTSFNNTSSPLVVEPGDFIFVSNNIAAELRLVTAVSNATHLSVNTAFSNTFPAGSIISRHIPAGSIVNMTKPTANINVISTSSANLYPGTTLNTDLNATVYYNIRRENAVGISKEIRKRALVNLDLGTSNTTGPWCLGLADAFRLRAVYAGNNFSKSNPNIGSFFTLDNGQRDTHYDLSYLRLRTGSSTLVSNTKLVVELDHFIHNRSSGVGFISVESYPIDDVNTSNTTAITTQLIPRFTQSDGTTVDLRDAIDFRPIVLNTANSSTTIAGATTNPSANTVFDVAAGGAYSFTPDENFISDFTYYLGRIDKVALTPQGDVTIINGVSSLQPITPADKDGTMTLGVVNIPPYPSLPTDTARRINRPDYSITITIQQNKRFTMRDIGVIEQRIDRLEYYTTLSLLESATKLRNVTDSNGNDRFKNGFLVDPFDNFSIADTRLREFRQFAPALDRNTGEIVPRQRRNWVKLDYSPSTSTNTTRTGSAITLNYTSEEFTAISNKRASITRSPSENLYMFKGNLTLSPAGTHRVDEYMNPIPVTIDTQQLAGIKTLSEVITRRHEVVNNLTANFTTPTESGGSLQQQNNAYNINTTLTGSLVPVGSASTRTAGTFVQNISVQEFIDPIEIRFVATGLKPNTRLYPYFDGVKVSQYCRSASSNFTTLGSFNSPLTTNSSGDLTGIFYLPPGVFRTGERLFRLIDVDDIKTQESSITTETTAIFHASNIDITKAQLDVRTRPVDIDLRQITTVDETVTTTNITIPGQPPVQPIINNITNTYNTINNITNVTELTEIINNITNITNETELTEIINNITNVTNVTELTELITNITNITNVTELTEIVNNITNILSTPTTTIPVFEAYTPATIYETNNSYYYEGTDSGDITPSDTSTPTCSDQSTSSCVGGDAGNEGSDGGNTSDGGGFSGGGDGQGGEGGDAGGDGQGN